MNLLQEFVIMKRLTSYLMHTAITFGLMSVAVVFYVYSSTMLYEIGIIMDAFIIFSIVSGLFVALYIRFFNRSFIDFNNE